MGRRLVAVGQKRTLYSWSKVKESANEVPLYHTGSQVTNKVNPSFQLVVGEQLSSITFVQDYWQFDFDGQGFTALTRVRGGRRSHGDKPYFVRIFV